MGLTAITLFEKPPYDLAPWNETYGTAYPDTWLEIAVDRQLPVVSPMQPAS